MVFFDPSNQEHMYALCVARIRTASGYADYILRPSRWGGRYWVGINRGHPDEVQEEGRRGVEQNLRELHAYLDKSNMDDELLVAMKEEMERELEILNKSGYRVTLQTQKGVVT